MGGSNLKPRTYGQVFALRNDQAMEENERVIAGASQSLISARFFKHHKLQYINLDVVISVSTTTGQSMLAKRLVVGCSLEFEGNVLMENLMVLAMEDFDCILGIGIFTYRALLDCYQKLGARPKIPLVSALRPCQSLESREKVYLIYAIDMSARSVGIKGLPVVNEFPDLFSDEIHGFPPVKVDCVADTSRESVVRKIE
ncbi:uncharacterized protein [Henckelia pumila]|uniref:uncharacterized protein n=1 Tax=Henckelia pumila TaxID=405737 RepID=UPI003C6DC88A